jgi:hypothetical protein
MIPGSLDQDMSSNSVQLKITERNEPFLYFKLHQKTSSSYSFYTNDAIVRILALLIVFRLIERREC